LSKRYIFSASGHFFKLFSYEGRTFTAMWLLLRISLLFVFFVAIVVVIGIVILGVVIVCGIISVAFAFVFDFVVVAIV